MTRAAQRLGLERSHLYKKMKRLGCRPETWNP
jgi:DNA-binding NtrC family response regulator